MTRTRLLATAALLTLLVGCGAATPAPEPAAPGTGPAAAPGAAGAAAPVSLAYPDVDVTGVPLSPTGLDETGAIDVPPISAPLETNYLAWAPEIAAGRPLVLTAHISGRGPGGTAVPGTFFRLADAEAGDTVTVTRSGGGEQRYTVTSVRTVDKAAFPTEVYRPRPEPTALLITCGGDLRDGDYDSNIIVEAVAS